MKKTKREKLEAAGWAVGSVNEFLGLSEADAALIEMKLALSRSLRDRRKEHGLRKFSSRNGSTPASPASRRWKPATRQCRWTSWSVPCWTSEPAPPILPTVRGGEKKTGPRAA